LAAGYFRSLLGNDIEFQKEALHITSVFNAVGGSVALDGANIVFTPKAGFAGVASFQYKIADSKGNPAITLALVDNASLSAEMKGNVLLRATNSPTDPEYTKQYYLTETKVAQVWPEYTGKGVSVLVMESSGSYATGAEYADLTHPDLAPNAAESFATFAAQPKSAHATLVASIIGAARNNIGGVGVAYEATLDSVSLGAGAVSGAWYQEQVSNMSDYDVVNNSWGYNILFKSPETTLAKNRAAIEDAAFSGRAGKGSILVFGAGNSRKQGDDSGLSGIASNPYVITVGGINKGTDIGGGTTFTAAFSTPGANVFISAPSSQIVGASTMVTGADGTQFSGDTTSSQGTSFATPIVSGVVALMLQANSRLTYRDVQEILALTASRGNLTGTSTWTANASTTLNGAGFSFSRDYGFGEVDARAAVRLAESWHADMGNKSNLAEIELPSQTLSTVADPGQETMVFNVSQNLRVEHAVVSLNLQQDRWSDLVIKLKSPSGTESILLNQPGLYENVDQVQAGGYGQLIVDLTSHQFRGEEAKNSGNGQWTLTIQDKKTGHPITGGSATLKLLGSESRLTNNQYVLTDDYALQQSNWLINDTNGGSDEINAAMMTGNVKLDLSGAAGSTVAGRAITINAGIEAAIGGGGNDTLTAGTANTYLYGGAGGDVLTGGSGTDVLIAGKGNDTLTGAGNTDLFLIDADTESITTIKDFNTAVAASGGDVLGIRTRDKKLAFDSINFTRSGNNLIISAGASKIILENTPATSLTNRQIITMRNGDNLPIDASGNYVTVGTVLVGAIGEVRWEYDLVIVDSSGSYSEGHYEPINVHWATGTNESDILIRGSDAPPMLFGASEAHTADFAYRWREAVSQMGDAVIYQGLGGDDDITGADQAEYLDGGSGSDTLRGGKGDDTLKGGSEADQFTFKIGDGADSIEDLALDDLVLFEGINKADVSRTFEFTNEGKEKFGVKTTLRYGSSNQVSFFNEYNTSQLNDAGGAALYNARFADTSETLASNRGNSITEDADIIEQSAYGSKTIKTLGGKDLIFSLKENGVDIDAGAGDDTVYALEGENVLNGGYGNDIVSVTVAPQDGRGLDTLYGGVGNDVLYSGDKSAVLYGDDIDATARISSENYGDTITGGAGADSIVGGFGNDSILGGGGNDSISGGDDNDTIYGGSGDDSLDGGAGTNLLSGEKGNDVYYVNANARSTIKEEYNGGTDSVYVSGVSSYTLGKEIEKLVLQSSSAAMLQGNELNNVITGNAGSDTITGGKGDDTLDGGAGLDTYKFTRGFGHDTIIDSRASIPPLDADLYQIDSSLSITNLIVTRPSGTNDAVISFLDGGDSITFKSWYAMPSQPSFWGISFSEDLGGMQNQFVKTVFSSPWLLGGTENDTLNATQASTWLRGESGNDVLTALSGKNYLLGGIGDDSLTGGINNDYLLGGEGADTLIGGKGDDVYIADDMDDVRESLNEGVDTIVSLSAYFALSNNIENLTISQEVSAVELDDGSLESRGVGNALANYLKGNKDANILEGGAGDDTLDGGLGSDQYNGGEGADIFIVTGTDSIYDIDARDSIQFAWQGATGDLVFTRQGSSLSINSSTSNDSVWVDKMFSADGSQINVDKVFMLNQQGGASKTYTALDILAKVTSDSLLTRPDGSFAWQGWEGKNDTFHGSLYSDYLDGGTGGFDFIFGEDGADTLVGNGSLDGGKGNDVIYPAYQLPNDITILSGGEGNDLVLGGDSWGVPRSAANNISGGTGNDTLVSGSTNDTLDGGAGNDQISGGGGDDLYLYKNGDGFDQVLSSGIGDVNYFSSGAYSNRLNYWDSFGQDTLRFTDLSVDQLQFFRHTSKELLIVNKSNLSEGVALDDFFETDYSFWSEEQRANAGIYSVEEIQFKNSSGSGFVSFDADQLATMISATEETDHYAGGADADVFNGLGGNDVLKGGSGNDTLYGGSGADLLMGGLDADALHGDYGDDTLFGLEGDDFLYGEAGGDLLIGGQGNDLYEVNSIADQVVEFINEGTDVVQSSTSWALSDFVENLVLVGTAAISGTGNTLANELTGNSAANTLKGGGGNDTFRGGAGNDVLSSTTSTTSNDTYIWGREEGADTLTDTGGMDQLQILAGVDASQVWLRRVSNNLEVSVIGTTDAMTITNWYTATANRIESLKLADGKTLTSVNAQKLVDAMAAGWSVPAQGQTTLPANYQSALGSVIASSWG